MPLLDVNNLTTHFFTDAGVVKAVDGVSFTIARGETLGIVGESGSGKSMTALSLMRLIPDPPGKTIAGTVNYFGKDGEAPTLRENCRNCPSPLAGEGRERGASPSPRLPHQGGGEAASPQNTAGNHPIDLLKLAPKEMRHIRGKRIAMVFQEPMTSLNPVYTIGDQIGEAIALHEGGSAKSVKDRAIEMLTLVGIPEPKRRYGEYPHQLSGGMRQRAMIGMALSCTPDLLLADEPTTALDVTIQAQILELIASLQAKLGMAMILVTHDFGVIAETTQRVIVMYAGRFVEEGKTRDIFAEPQHPYTQGLLKSIPPLEKMPNGTLLPTIKGTVPNLAELPMGCAFQDRCPRVQQKCRESEVPYDDIGRGRRVRCFFPGV